MATRRGRKRTSTSRTGRVVASKGSRGRGGGAGRGRGLGLGLMGRGFGGSRGGGGGGGGRGGAPFTGLSTSSEGRFVPPSPTTHPQFIPPGLTLNDVLEADPEGQPFGPGGIWDIPTGYGAPSYTGGGGTSILPTSPAPGIRSPSMVDFASGPAGYATTLTGTGGRTGGGGGGGGGTTYGGFVGGTATPQSPSSSGGRRTTGGLMAGTGTVAPTNELDTRVALAGILADLDAALLNTSGGTSTRGGLLKGQEGGEGARGRPRPRGPKAAGKDKPKPKPAPTPQNVSTQGGVMQGTTGGGTHTTTTAPKPPRQTTSTRGNDLPNTDPRLLK